jgi:cysteine desulfurase / selenocysteine lyase
LIEMAAIAPMADLAVEPGTAWLYTGAEGPPLATQAAAFGRYLANRALGPAGRDEHTAVEQRLRERLARMLGLRPEDIGLVSNSSEAINMVANSLRLEPGDNVVLNDLEYPSVVLPWLRLASLGVEIRLARHTDWSMPPTLITSLIDKRTKLVGLSHVSYHSGWRHDLAAISDSAGQVGAQVMVDATQSLGVIDIPTELIDVTIASSYKWLLGGHGLGIIGWNQRRRPLPLPAGVGWRSLPQIFTDDRFEHYQLREDARRFELGFPSYPSIYQLDDSLAWLCQFDTLQVEKHVLALGGKLLEGLAELGKKLLTPSEPHRRAGNISFSAQNGEAVAAALSERGIYCWGGDGRVRVSIHLFNSEDDIARLLGALSDLPGRLQLPDTRR